MSDATRDLLVRGIAAYKARDFGEARHYLDWLLRLEPPVDQRLDALMCLVEISRDPVEQRSLLEEALAYDPAEPRARRWLAILEGRLDPAQVVDPDRIPPPTAPLSAVEASARRFSCPSCGGRMVFTPDGQSLVCESCARREHPAVGPGARPGAGPADGLSAAPASPEEDFTVAMATARGHLAPVQQHIFVCQGCGTSFVLQPQQLSLTCPYCESVYVITETQSRELVTPSGVVPFHVSEGRARQIVQNWLEACQTDPSLQASAGHGLYLPAWAFDLGGQVAWRCQVRAGRDLWSGRETWETRQDVELVYLNDLLVPASRHLPEVCRPGLAHYNLKEMVPYNERYLADWPAETYQVTVGDASLEARMCAFQKEQERVKARLMLQQVRDLTFSSLGLIIESFKLVLLPAWLAYYTLEGKRCDVMVNGQTGQVTSPRPRLR